MFTDPPPTTGYEPPLHLYSDPYPIFKVEGLTFLIPAKKPWKHDMIFINRKMPLLHLHQGILLVKANRTSNHTVINLTA